MEMAEEMGDDNIFIFGMKVDEVEALRKRGSVHQFTVCLCVSVCVSVCLCVYLSVCLCVCLSLCLSVCLSLCPSMRTSACPLQSVCLLHCRAASSPVFDWTVHFSVWLTISLKTGQV